MATQVKFATPNSDFCVIDNSSAPTFPSLNAGAHIGYDTTAPGATSQGSNPVADTGTVLLDSVNDTVYADPQVSTLKGNPVAGTQPTYAKVSTILNDVGQGLRLLWKNPAIVFFGF
jgi:hypothetical protein